MEELTQKRMRVRIPVWTISIVVLSIVSFISSELSSLFIYDRVAILGGELWRLFTSHLVHFSYFHFLYNIIAFGVLGWVIEQQDYPYFGSLLLLMAFIIGVALLVMKPDMLFYGGLSGLAHGAFFYLALHGLYHSLYWRRISLLAIGIISMKVTIEWYQEIFVVNADAEQEYITMHLSHIIGVAVAVMFFLVLAYNKHRENNL
ncbi:MAG: rhombosortase [Campylobacterota bacterium]